VAWMAAPAVMLACGAAGVCAAGVRGWACGALQ